MSRRGIDRASGIDLVRLAIFMVITALATGLLMVTIGNISFGGTQKYQAVFSDATGVVSGDDVRIAGVKVGTVKSVRIDQRTRARVTFTVRDDHRLGTSTQAQLRFRNIVGQRYLSLTQTHDTAARLPEGGTIPIANTQPALDLTTLFNGFKPLFQALSPDEINTLSYEIIEVFQGEGGTVESLLSHTASVTQTIASRDTVIDSLIENLNGVLSHLGERDTELGELITTLKSFVAGLESDKAAILGSLDSIAEVSVQTADLLTGIRTPLTKDVTQLRALTTNLVDGRAEIDRALQVLPIKLNKIGNTASYGSWFNFYLCDFTGVVKLPGGERIELGTEALKLNIGSRCNLG